MSHNNIIVTALYGSADVYRYMCTGSADVYRYIKDRSFHPDAFFELQLTLRTEKSQLDEIL